MSNENQQPQTQYLLIPESLAQSVVNFLATQPYGQVFRLIAGMQELKSVTLESQGPAVQTSPGPQQAPQEPQGSPQAAPPQPAEAQGNGSQAVQA